MAAPYNLKSRIRSALRRVWLWSPMRREAMEAARVRRGFYKCGACDDIRSRKDVNVDHITMVTPAGGITDWDVFINRLFCPANKLTVLCKPCHTKKTQKERESRKKSK